MKPTMHLRWDERNVYAGDIAIARLERVLQQFWEIADNESDITLPKEIGPDGVKGRWRDIG